jgi:formate hydrogenlyase subunit 6/NADH:ubiquinone oxidoreductase subunit I
MPLTARGEAIFERIPNSAPRESTGSIGCEIVRHEELCIGCARCASVCPTGATETSGTFDPMQLFAAPPDSRRGALGEALRKIARHQPSGPIEVPGRVSSFRSIVYEAEKCIGCGVCARICPTGAVEAIPVSAAEIASSRGGEAA